MIGLCCHYIVPNNKASGFTNILNEKTLQLKGLSAGKYSDEQILATYLNNIKGVSDLLTRAHSEGIRLYRMSSGLMPLWDLVNPNIKNDPKVLTALKKVGDFVLSKGMRMSCHPDQFVVLSSDNPNVIQNSIKMLEMHAWIFDQMGLPDTTYYAINIHGGKRGNDHVLIDSIGKLPSNIRNRLTLENDESSYSVKKLCAVSSAVGVPVVYDSHHHSFNEDGLSSEDAMESAIATWKVRPLTHLSNTTPGMENGSFRERRKHSDYVHYIPEHQRVANNSDRIDIEAEFKMKNLAIFKAIKDFDLRLA